MSAGAAPNATMSAIESYCAPNSLCVLVQRATRPSMPSSTMAMKMAMQPTSKRPFIACTMAKKPQNRTPSGEEIGQQVDARGAAVRAAGACVYDFGLVVGSFSHASTVSAA